MNLMWFIMFEVTILNSDRLRIALVDKKHHVTLDSICMEIPSKHDNMGFWLPMQIEQFRLQLTQSNVF